MPFNIQIIMSLIVTDQSYNFQTFFTLGGQLEIFGTHSLMVQCWNCVFLFVLCSLQCAAWGWFLVADAESRLLFREYDSAGQPSMRCNQNKLSRNINYLRCDVIVSLFFFFSYFCPFRVASVTWPGCWIKMCIIKNIQP